MERETRAEGFELFNGLAVSHRLTPKVGILGRSGAEPDPDIGLDEDTVSARHARWEVGRFGVEWQEGGSTWGTTYISEALNGGKETPLPRAGVMLGEGDRLRFGRGGWWWLRRPQGTREGTARFTGLLVEVTGPGTGVLKRLAGKEPVGSIGTLAPERVRYLLTFLQLLGPEPGRVLDYGAVSQACGKSADAGYRLQLHTNEWVKGQGILDRSGGAGLHRLYASSDSRRRGVTLDLPFDGLVVEDAQGHLGHGPRWSLRSD